MVEDGAVPGPTMHQMLFFICIYWAEQSINGTAGLLIDPPLLAHDPKLIEHKHRRVSQPRRGADLQIKRPKETFQFTHKIDQMLHILTYHTGFRVMACSRQLGLHHTLNFHYFHRHWDPHKHPLSPFKLPTNRD